ncbi:hypothetical protein DFH11DRAFT_1623504 [Phellopilus nigrolimitatus]|nr:hypothetical protein DFH11DRAFT_1623504 [Phellopilus nigrolimitatus]
MSPVSLGSPMRNSPPIPSHNVNIHHDPAFGPNPPSIVYAPARHGQTTHYSPPRIMYIPGASLRGQAQAQAPPRERSPTGSVRRAATIASPSADMHEGLPREGLDVRNAWPGEGWGAERREGSLMRQASVAQDQFTHTYPSPVHGDTHVPAAVGSTGTSTADADGNMAGVGTLQNRSRSRSRSRARGMAFSASEPHPVAPTAVMMAAPPEAPGLGSIPMTTRHAGLTPYPTPPGSSGSHHPSIAAPGPDPVAEPIHSARIPDNGNVGGNVSGGGGGLMSRFRDLRLSSAVPTPAPGSPRRGRAKALEVRRERKEPRALSADSEVSHSSASTYYVIQTPGQKVRIIRTDGQTVTATTTASRFSAPNAGGWLKKALTPRFLHTSAAAVQPAPAMGRMDSSGSKKREGRKLVRRNSTGTTALLSRQPSVNAP